MAYVIVSIFFIGGFKIYDICKDSLLLTLFIWAVYITCFAGIIAGALQEHSKHFKP